MTALPERAVLRAIYGSHRLIVSQAVEDEYCHVLLRAKFDRYVTRERRQGVLDLLLIAAVRVEPAIKISECADPKDNKYLELAAAGGADVIVSSDKRHLLALHPWRGVKILSPAEFL